MDEKNTSKSVVARQVYRIHFILLYVMLYSTFRNALWFVNDLAEVEVIVLRSLIFGFGVWFIGAKLFLPLGNNRGGWSRKDYLSKQVVMATLIIVCLLEVFVFA